MHVCSTAPYAKYVPLLSCDSAHLRPPSFPRKTTSPHDPGGGCETSSQTLQVSRVTPQIPLEPAIRRRRSQNRSDVAVQLQLCITHRPLDLHRYPRPLLIQACFRHLPALLFRPQSSIYSRHEIVRSPHPQTRPFRLVLYHFDRVFSHAQ